MKDANVHWTGDAELLADFVLDRLERPVRQRLEVHLHECERCRKAVDLERTIVAGTKLLGREGLKSRLQGRVAVSRSRQIPWPHILSAAAVLVIITGIGVFNRWFVTREDAFVGEAPVVESQSVPPEADATKESPRTGKEEDVSLTGKAVPANKAFTPPVRKKELTLNEARPGVAPANRPETDRLQDMELSDRARAVLKERDNARRNVLPSETEFSAQEGKSSARPAASAEHAGVEPEQARAAPGRAAWAQGTIIEQLEDSGMDVHPSFKVQQRPLAALPPSQQQFRQDNAVQALIERTETGDVHITLFLESLLDEGQLSGAIVQQISPDSILVVVGGQVISYRIPSGAYQADPMK